MVIYKLNKYGLNLLHILDSKHLHFQIGISFFENGLLPSLNIILGRLQVIYAYVYIDRKKKV